MPGDLKANLPLGWSLIGDNKSLFRTLRFRDFRSAFAFMTRVASESEAMNHHPDWSNSYNQVTVSLTSHDTGSVTDRDVQLAERINQVIRDMKAELL